MGLYESRCKDSPTNWNESAAKEELEDTWFTDK